MLHEYINGTTATLKLFAACCFGLTVHIVEFRQKMKPWGVSFSTTQVNCALPAQREIATIKSKQKAGEESGAFRTPKKRDRYLDQM